MAYCEDMKQTRASDEPMTKFMKCNSCGHQWRCEWCYSICLIDGNIFSLIPYKCLIYLH